MTEKPPAPKKQNKVISLNDDELYTMLVLGLALQRAKPIIKKMIKEKKDNE